MALSLSAGLGGCAKDPVGAEGPTGGENRFTLTFAGRTTAALPADQTETVYAGMRFAAYRSPYTQSGNLSGAGTFSHEVILKRDGNVYTGMMRTGNWGLAAVSPRSDLLPLPGAGAEMTSTPMYRMPEDATSCPEIFFGSVTLPEIVADQDEKADMSLARNMSQVYVRILDKDDIVDRSKRVTVSLHDVPNTVSWAGNILPDKTKPELREEPIVLTIPADEQWTDSLSTDNKPLFKMSSMGHHTVIPAHRGSDFWNADGTMNDNPTDILEHKMKIALTYNDKWGAEQIIEATAVPEVPRCNGRIVYNLIPVPKSTDVVIVTELLPWNVEDTQTETVKRKLNAANCVVVAPGRAAEFSVEDVFQTWNLEHNAELGGKMAQDQTLVAEVISGSDLISAEVVNPMGNGATGAHHSVRVKAANPNMTGEATVGLKLQGDQGYRWIWHVHVTSDPQAHTDGHCPWTAAASADRDWGSAAPDQQKGFGVVVTKAGATTSPASKVVTLKTEPGALPYKVTLVTANGGSTKVDAAVATICLWNGTQMKADVSELYAVPGHATDICVQINNTTNFTGGYLRIEQCKLDGSFGTAQYVQVGKGTTTPSDVSVTYAGGNATLTVPNIAVTYPDGTTANITGNWTAQPCDENGNPAVSDWVTLNGLSVRAAAQKDLTEPMKAYLPVSGYDLSTRGGKTPMNTANCYIVRAEGTYSLPLVYGNAIKDGQTNTSAYTSTATGTNVLSPFINHTGAGIANPYIKDNNITLTEAKLLWQDVEGMIDESSVKIDGNNLTFRVTNSIDYGNAVLAVFDNAGQIAWSWHIWATDYDPYAAGGTKTVQNRTAPNTTYDFMTQNLGWCPGPKYEARSQHLLLTEAETGATVVVTIEQTAHTLGNNTYYQWGRKDPFPGGLTGNVNKPTYGPAEYIWPATGNAPGSQTIRSSDITEYIKNPYKFNLNSSMDGRYYNLWSANNNVDDVNTTKPVKTVYDPSPTGFVMPPNGAFSGFTTTGENENAFNSSAEFNVDGAWASGWNFYCNTNGTGETIYFHASGGRSNDGMISGMATYSYIWHAVSQYGNRYNLYFTSRYVAPKNTNVPNGGFAVRPVRE